MALKFTGHDVRGLAGIRQFFPPSRSRCGIYILGFADGQGYVGQAVDVVRRYAQHRHTWEDIVDLRFADCPREELDRWEQVTIRDQHPIRVLRNVVDVPPGRVGPANLDAVVSIDEQEKWLAAAGSVPDESTRRQDLQLRAAHHAAYQRLEASGYLADVVQVFRPYIGLVVPYPRRTERDFWAVSAMPSTNRTRRHQRLAALSINNVETLVMYRYDEETYGFLNLSKSVFVDMSGGSEEAELRAEGYAVEDAEYRIGAGDIVRIDSQPEMLSALLSRPAVVDAAKHLNLNLMRRGRSFQWRWHNYELADLLLE